MKIHELRNLSVEELATRIATLERDYMGMAENVRVGKEKNHAQLQYVRRNIARLKTLLHEQRAARS